jgi:hypothetical protein
MITFTTLLVVFRTGVRSEEGSLRIADVSRAPAGTTTMARMTTAANERGIVEREPPSERERVDAGEGASVAKPLLAVGIALAGAAVAAIVWKTYRPYRGC